MSDPLTNLPNRRAFARKAQTLRRRYIRKNLATGMLLLDVDDCKTINDLHGHEAGDQVLRQVGGRLCAGMAEGEYLARLGGDEQRMENPRQLKKPPLIPLQRRRYRLYAQPTVPTLCLAQPGVSIRPIIALASK